MSQLLTGVVTTWGEPGEMCLEMRIFHSGRRLESVQSESHGLRQVVTSD